MWAPAKPQTLLDMAEQGNEGHSAGARDMLEQPLPQNIFQVDEGSSCKNGSLFRCPSFMNATDAWAQVPCEMRGHSWRLHAAGHTGFSTSRNFLTDEKGACSRSQSPFRSQQRPCHCVP